jgi:hypothetical protein
VKSTKETTLLSCNTRPRRTTTRRHCRTASSCGRGSAVLAYLMSLSFRINRLTWRLVWPHLEEAAQSGPQTCGEEVEGHGDHIPRGKLS